MTPVSMSSARKGATLWRLHPTIRSFMSHTRAVWLMVVVTLLWSMAGVVTRHLEAARSFEVTFWRSFFNVVALSIGLTVWRGPGVWRAIVRAPRVVWISGVCWCVQFTAFMQALTLTSVANVLITMALGPLITALFVRVVLGHRLALRTWGAIVVAGVGIAWMYGQQLSAGVSIVGTAVAIGVPIAAAVNFTVLQHVGFTADRATSAPAQDMLPAVLIGAALSALVVLPLAYPFQASAHDLGLLALLGGVQLAIPCLMMVMLARVLPAPEVSLLALLEVVFGVTWAWLGAGEEPSSGALIGGLLVLGALVGNELLGWRQRALPAVVR